MKLDQLAACAAEAGRDELSRNLLRAYTACLGVVDLCNAAVLTLDSPAAVRSAIRSRLVWLGREGVALPEIDELGRRLIPLSPSDAKARERLDTLLSHLYPFLTRPTRQCALERWRGRGTRSAATRWLKAITEDDLLFNAEAVLEYWRASGDQHAAQLLANRADPSLLAEILWELVQGCEEGWIVSRAALRSAIVSEEDWAAIRATFPASYAYLCAKTGRVLSEPEALSLVLEAGAGLSGERGLAIWAIGQLGLWSVLDQVRAAAPELRNQDLKRLGLATVAHETRTLNFAGDGGS